MRLPTMQKRPSMPDQHLSKRELECLKWVALGKTSWETGRILGLSEHTINFHMRNACQKLGADNRLAAVAIALRQGLI